MKILKITLGIASLLAAAAIGYNYLPQAQYAFSDWYERQGTPTFTEPPYSFSPRSQEQIIAENQARGHKLICYGDLKGNERIRASNDYVCIAPISTAYDDIPARSVVFFFSKGKLEQVRMEFPAGSFPELQDYLSKELAGYQRIFNQHGTDPYGKPLNVWPLNHGELMVSAEDTPGETQIVLWTAYP